MAIAFEDATSMEMVDEALTSAEADANYLQSRMNEALAHIIEVHGLASADESKKSAEEKLADQLSKAIAKDINTTAGKAVNAADRRKAQLEKESANRQQAILDATVARAANAGAEIAGLKLDLTYNQNLA